MPIDEFKKVMAKSRHKTLYHFTDRANLSSIRRYGILSKKEAAGKEVRISVYGGNEWSHDADARKGLNDYVNLCFTTNHPMCHMAQKDGRICNPQYLPIDADVLKIDGVRITLGVANETGTKLLSVAEGLKLLDCEVLYDRTDWKDPKIMARLKAAEKCEVLVPKIVPVNLIKF